MTVDWKRIRDVFEQALDVEPRDRPSFFDAVCGADTELRAAVEALLAEEPTVVQARRQLFRGNAEEVGPGTLVDGKYQIDSLLGAGGMGAVYRARHLQLERDVALKVIRGELVADPSTAERFRREAIAVARLRHPNIVTVHDYGIAEGVGAYLVLELLDGRSLHKELAARGRIDVGEALGLMHQMCDAVGTAHRAGVIHRDLKPENIFLEGSDGAYTVKVLDFGLAKLEQAIQSPTVRLTGGGAVLGTPTYLSPEQCRGEETDARSDVYALGCVLFEMLTGKPPFGGANVWSLVYQHVNDEPPRPRDRLPSLTPEVDQAILQSLAKAPDDRHPTPEAFAAALGIDTSVEASSGLRSTEIAAPAEPTAVEPPPNNLPHAVTRFVGREQEIREVREWLQKARVVTLVGPGGIGKTRLAIETAARAADEFRDGIWLVELASLADPALLARSVGAALGVPEQHDRSASESIEAWLTNRRVLLVLDNCEHLVGACAGLAERLLGACAGLRILATSRESLAVAGEAVWQVPALAVASDASGRAPETDEAVQLFLDRAALAKPSFASAESATGLVEELCRRLEGIPLAIELAAARVKVLSVDQILQKLDDRFRLLSGGSRTAPSRHRALQATLDWSHDLLTDEERTLFRRLSVFAGGWTLEAAEAIASDEPSSRHSALSTQHSALHILSRLIDKSLVTVNERRGAARFGMLEMIREYAADLQSRSDEAETVRRRHAEYFTAQSKESRNDILEGHSVKWLDSMEAEHDNVRAALAWSLDHDPDGSLALASAVTTFRGLRGYMSEARRSLEAALARSPAASALLRMNALVALGNVAAVQGDLAASRACFEQSLPLARATGSTDQVAASIFHLAAISNMEGDLKTSRAQLEECLAISREAGHANVVSLSLNGLGEVARLEGDSVAARSYYEQAVAVSRDANHDHFLLVPLCNLGAVACEAGDAALARASYEEALAMSRALASDEFVSLALDGLAAVAAKRGAWDRASRLAGAAAAMLERSGAVLAPVERAFRERYLAEIRERIGEHTLAAAQAEGRAMTPEQAIACALSA